MRACVCMYESPSRTRRRRQRFPTRVASRGDVTSRDGRMRLASWLREEAGSRGGAASVFLGEPETQKMQAPRGRGAEVTRVRADTRFRRGFRACLANEKRGDARLVRPLARWPARGRAIDWSCAPRGARIGPAGRRVRGGGCTVLYSMTGSA
jgi:hypothetical protein